VIAVSYHDRVNVLQGTAPRISGPFDRAEWFALLAGSGHGAQPPMIALASGAGTQAALPLLRANGRLEPLRNWYSFTWRPLAPIGREGDALLGALARDLRHRSHRITFWPVPDEEGCATRLEIAFRAAGWMVRREQCEHNHVLPVNGRTFDEYWATRPGQMRSTLKRKGGKVAVTLLTRFDPAAWAEYEDVYAQSWKGEEGDPALLRRFAEQEGVAGRLRLAIAHHEGRAVAAQFWTVEADCAFIHKLAYLEEMRHLSAGTTLSAALFRQAIDADGVAMIDFGLGNEPYKAHWMEEVRPRFLIDCLDPRSPRAWPALGRHLAARLARTDARS